MPTYGSPETVKDFPYHPALEKSAQLIAALLKERSAIVETCDHHFIPDKNAIETLRETLVSGVYNAGQIRDLDDTLSDVSFPLKCSQCDHKQYASPATRCPICAEKTKGEWGDLDDLEKYFGNLDFLHFGLWLISCPSADCSFKAAGRLWDK